MKEIKDSHKSLIIIGTFCLIILAFTVKAYFKYESIFELSNFLIINGIVLAISFLALYWIFHKKFVEVFEQKKPHYQTGLLITWVIIKQIGIVIAFLLLFIIDTLGSIGNKSSKTYTDSKGYPRYKDSNRLVHRSKAAKKLGRPLRPGEVVHHKNENKQDYSFSNLKVCKNNEEHLRKYHRQ